MWEREVEEFLRRSPSVRRPTGRPPSAGADGRAPAVYDELEAAELVGILPSLEPPALEELRDYEAAHQGRAEVLDAIDSHLERSG